MLAALSGFAQGLGSGMEMRKARKDKLADGFFDPPAREQPRQHGRAGGFIGLVVIGADPDQQRYAGQSRQDQGE